VVSRLKVLENGMNTTLELHMPVAETMDTDLRVLNENELDDVNGGFIPLFIGAAILGAGIGYLIGRGIACTIMH
jgi:lactobin A/cerein 7B family class IIb bacteriocin